MKKLVLPAIGLLASVLAAQAQLFSPTNLVVMTLGNGSEVLATTGNAVSLSQYTPQGDLITTTPLPTNGANAFLVGGSAPKEGYVALSADGRFLVFGGYNLTYGTNTTALGLTSGGVVPRAVGTLDGNGNYTLQFSGNVESAANMCGATSDGLGNFWVNGGNTGITYISNNAVQAVVSTSSTSEECLNIFGGNLYYSTAGAGGPGVGLWQVPGLPMTSANQNNVNTNAVGKAAGTHPAEFVVNTTLGLAYLCDYGAASSGGGISRFDFNGTNWSYTYTISTGSQGAYGLAVDFNHSTPFIYATVGGTSPSAANTLVAVEDSGAGSVPAVIATASAGETFRGLSWGPGTGPVITGPSSLTNDYGESVTFTPTITGSPYYYVQWYSNSQANTNFVAIPDATNTTLTISNLTAAQNGSIFYLTVSNAYGTAQSADATLTANPPGAPIDVVVTPTNQTVNVEGTATFTATFAGATTGLSFGWRLNGKPLANGAFGPSMISGANTATLTISNVFATNDGSYTVYVTNSFSPPYGTNAVAAVLNVMEPGISTNIIGDTNYPGATPYTLSVGAIGTGLTYQWLSNGVPISGANGSTYTVPDGLVSNTASYSVIVSNSTGQSITNGPVIVSYTPVLLYDTFNYPAGDLFGDPGSAWKDINGSNPEIVGNGSVQISETDQTTDAQRLFGYPVPVGLGSAVWASFIINVNTLPPPDSGGTYFANLEDTNFGFYARLFTLTSNYDALTPGVATTAYPGTYRIGIAGKQNDYSPDEADVGPTAIVPLDMAPGINYEVVFYYDPSVPDAGVAVNPAAYGDTTNYYPVTGVFSGPSQDTFTADTNAIDGFGLRQRQNEGIIYLSQLEVSWDWNGPGSGYAVVTSAYTPTNPVIGLQPASVTNYSGDPYLTEIAASGIGEPGVGLTYQWYQGGTALSDGTNITGSATPALFINSLVASNSGTYYCKVTGAGGSTLSSNALISVTTALTAPSFTLPGGIEPQSVTTNFQNQSQTFSAVAVGTGPISYQWYFNNGTNTYPIGGDSGTLTLNDLQTSESGTYYVIATGGTGLTATSSNAVLVVQPPDVVTISYLRSLLDPVAFAVTNYSDTFLTINGVITTATNLTSGDTSSYYIQDATGGINLFVTDGSDFRPQLGDYVTASGILSIYADNLELDVDEGSPGYANLIISTNYPLPTPILLDWTNNTSPLSAAIAKNVEGSVVKLTNLWFEAYSNGAVFTSGTYYTVTNASGVTFSIHVSAQDTNCVTGQPIPQFASSIAGPLVNDNAFIQIEFTVYSNLVVGSSSPPVTITNVSGALVPGGITLSWTPVAGATYSVLQSTNVAGPYTNKLATGLTNGTYTETPRPTTPTSFYLISSP